MILLTILIFIIILGVLVFVHELGHFLMAKRAGMRVDEFGFGFPPRLFGIRRGETLYSINLIPLGGFVRIMGEDGAETVDPESFGNKSGWQRFGVLIAGVTMNLILAWVLLSVAMGLGMPTVLGENQEVPGHGRVADARVGILEVALGSPASKAGVKPGDVILKINGVAVESTKQAQELTSANAERETKYEFQRGKEVLEKTIVPRQHPPEGEGALGIALGTVGRVSYPWYEAIYRGLMATVSILVGTVAAFGNLIAQLFQGGKVNADLSGPVGIAVLTRDVAKLGFVYLLQFTALLSINLAVINAVPFPALDGGRVLFLAIEKIRRRKLPVMAEQLANTLGFLLLLLLMLAVTVHDFGKFNIIQRLKDLI